jgi:hypothetical protein
MFVTIGLLVTIGNFLTTVEDVLAYLGTLRTRQTSVLRKTLYFNDVKIPI